MGNHSELKGYVTFIDKSEPKVEAGDYEIEIEQKLSVQNEPFKAKQIFSVYSERFEIGSNLIHSLFPPQGNLGNYSLAFPQIALKKATLPYERSASLNEKKPWLALLLFDEDEYSTIWSIDRDFFIRNYGDEKEAIEILKFLKENSIIKPLDEEELIYEVNRAITKNNIEEFEKGVGEKSKEILKKVLYILDKAQNGQLLKLSELLKVQDSNSKGVPIFPKIALEIAQRPEDIVKVIDIKWSVFKKLIPKYEELEFLIHSRRVEIKEEGIDEIRAIITTNTLPKSGVKQIAHLVSLENWFKNNGEYSIDIKDNSIIRLVSLKDWNFSSITPDKKFEDILKKLSVDSLKSHQNSLNLENRDLLILPHKSRSGGKSISYYRSPLISGSDIEDMTNINLAFPAKSADELLRYDPNTGMFESSYATAYEMGRLLTLQTPKSAFEILSWKRELYREKITWSELAKNSHLPLPKDEEKKELQKGQMPKDVRQWFDELFLLKYVPFSLLVPFEEMLPKESIRFFQIDPLWLQALLDGAFSIGRVTDVDKKNDEMSMSDAELIIDKFKTYTGLLIRSEVVAGWPDMDVVAVSEKLDEDKPFPKDKKLPRLRMDTLSKDIMICIFEGEISTVDIFIKPEGIHSGVKEEDGKYYKKWKIDGEKIKMDIPFRDNRFIDIENLIKDLKQEQKNSAFFSFNMIEGMPRIRFNKGEL